MSGVSRGGLHGENGIGVFRGELSLEHGGGFASVRRDPEAIQQVGFLIADRRSGPFRLEVAWRETMNS